MRSFKESFCQPGKKDVPVKYIMHQNSNIIKPICLTINPTNRCNLNCSYCFFTSRNKNIELDYSVIEKCIKIFKKLGLKSVILTGGGEPLMHRDIVKIIKLVHGEKLEIGIVSNGLLLDKILDVIDKVFWIRFSISDENSWENLRQKLNKLPKGKTNYSIAYIYQWGDLGKMKSVLEYVKKNGFTHFRIVGENFKKISGNKIKTILNDDKTVYIDDPSCRQSENCIVGLEKPYLDVSGKIYACCITSEHKNGGTNPICSISGIEETWKAQKYEQFNCKKCSFSCQNKYLNIVANMKNINFL